MMPASIFLFVKVLLEMRLWGMISRSSELLRRTLLRVRALNREPVAEGPGINLFPNRTTTGTTIPLTPGCAFESLAGSEGPTDHGQPPICYQGGPQGHPPRFAQQGCQVAPQDPAQELRGRREGGCRRDREGGG